MDANQAKGVAVYREEDGQLRREDRWTGLTIAIVMYLSHRSYQTFDGGGGCVSKAGEELIDRYEFA